MAPAAPLVLICIIGIRRYVGRALVKLPVLHPHSPTLQAKATSKLPRLFEGAPLVLSGMYVARAQPITPAAPLVLIDSVGVCGNVRGTLIRPRPLKPPRLTLQAQLPSKPPRLFKWTPL